MGGMGGVGGDGDGGREMVTGQGIEKPTIQ